MTRMDRYLAANPSVADDWRKLMADTQEQRVDNIRAVLADVEANGEPDGVRGLGAHLRHVLGK